MKKNKLISERIRIILETSATLRDDDRRLMIAVWREDIMQMPVGLALQKKLLEILDGFSTIFEGKDESDKSFYLTNTETIRRSRQQVQEQNPHLRGTHYADRQEEQNEWLEELNYRPASQPVHEQMSMFDEHTMQGITKYEED